MQALRGDNGDPRNGNSKDMLIHKYTARHVGCIICRYTDREASFFVGIHIVGTAVLFLIMVVMRVGFGRLHFFSSA